MLRALLVVTATFLIGLGVFAASLWIWGSWYDEWSGLNASLEFSNGWCNVAVIPITGDILPGAQTEESAGADDVLASLRKAESDPELIGILLRIDSSGGAPASSEAIAEALKASRLPSMAYIREMGTSGAYLVATGADQIYASEFSDVGGIGVTMSYVQNVRQNAKDGLDFVSLASAPYKDYMNPNMPLTREERAILERDLSIYHDVFVRQVAENRSLPVENIRQLADGASMPGSLALESKLVDALGGQGDTRAWFAEQAGIKLEDVVFCE